MHYTIDRTPGKPHPAITAWGALQAARGYVAVDPGHRNRITKADAARLVKLYYGKPLDVALREGVIYPPPNNPADG